MARWPESTATRYPELRYCQVDKDWRFINELSVVGPIYKTKMELLADMDAYAVRGGWATEPVELDANGHRACPFCKSLTHVGEGDEDPNDPGIWRVVCHNCGASGPNSTSRKEARLDWNVRP